MSTTHNFDVPAAGTLAGTDQYLQANATTGRSAYATGEQLRSFIGSGFVSTTATTLSVSAASHAGRVIAVNSAAPIAITLPQATGTGNTFRFVFGVAATGTVSTIKVGNATDNMNGGMAIFDTSATDITAIAFAATATDDTISVDGTTRAGTVGTIIDIIDVKSGLFAVRMTGAATGSYATPFSATV